MIGEIKSVVWLVELHQRYDKWNYIGSMVSEITSVIWSEDQIQRNIWKFLKEILFSCIWKGGNLLHFLTNGDKQFVKNYGKSFTVFPNNYLSNWYTVLCSVF